MDNRPDWLPVWWRKRWPWRSFGISIKLALAAAAAVCCLSSQTSSAQATLTTGDSPQTTDVAGSSVPVGAFRFDGGPKATYAFSGAGFGHGVGMSQWGARGRAEAGQDATAILAAYYTGVSISTDLGYTPIERVLVYHGAFPSKNARIDVTAGTIQIAGTSSMLTAGAHVDLSTPPKGPPSLHAFDAAGSPTDSLALDLPVTLRGSDASRLRVAFKSAPKVPDTVLATYNVYRGDLTLRATATTLDVIDTLPLDPYLYGTVPAEMPSTWPVEALRAQAIAARTYAVHAQRGDAAAWDIDDSTSSQVYLGALKEQPASNAAVASTSGTVLTYGGAPITAYYHACDAGHTEDASHLFPGVSLPYALGVADTDSQGQPYDRECPRSHWDTKASTRQHIEAGLGSDVVTRIGSLDWIDLSSRSDTGRLLAVVVGGVKGSVAIPAQQFRQTYNHNRPEQGDQLFSTNFVAQRRS